MQFHIEIDLDALPQPHDAELERTLRYWAGSLSHYDLSAETSESIHDSAYEEVGSWRVTAGEARVGEAEYSQDVHKKKLARLQPNLEPNGGVESAPPPIS
ncbi:hypothetical protein VR010_08260 [Actinomycetaceae bacterium L2_0104]